MVIDNETDLDKKNLKLKLWCCWAVNKSLKVSSWNYWKYLFEFASKPVWKSICGICWSCDCALANECVVYKTQTSSLFKLTSFVHWYCLFSFQSTGKYFVRWLTVGTHRSNRVGLCDCVCVFEFVPTAIEIGMHFESVPSSTISWLRIWIVEICFFVILPDIGSFVTRLIEDTFSITMTISIISLSV